MNKKKKIHFEISERKILLRIFDVVSVLFSLYLIGLFFDFKYFKITETNYSWTIVLGIYLISFGSVFEMYNLQVASNQLQSIKSVFLTTSAASLAYLLTPVYTPVLPNNRIQIFFFYILDLILYIWLVN